MKIPFTKDLIKNLKFERRPTGVDGDGSLILDPKATPDTLLDWSVRDASLPGFGIRVTRGSKSYFVQRKRGSGVSDRYTLTEQSSFRKARAQAQSWLGRMAKGEDPREERKDINSARLLKRSREAFTFGKVYEGYMAGGVNLKPGTIYDRKLAGRWLATEAVWEAPLFGLSKSTVHETFAPMFSAAAKAKLKAKSGKSKRKRGGGPHQDIASAWKAFRHCSAAWNTSEAEKAPANPFTAWKREHRATLPRVERRDTILPLHTDAGVQWIKALVALRNSENHTMAVAADYLVCVLLWGGRRTEIQVLRWADIDEGEGSVRFRAETTKTGRDLWLPLTDWARSIVQARRAKNKKAKLPIGTNDWVFPSIVEGAHIVELRDLQEALREATGLWIGPHDLRRTIASDVFGDTKSVRTVGIALGHAASDSDVSAGYVPKAERLRALRPLYEQRERRLKALVGMSTKTTPLTSAQEIVLKAAQEMIRSAGITAANLTNA